MRLHLLHLGWLLLILLLQFPLESNGFSCLSFVLLFEGISSQNVIDVNQAEGLCSLHLIFFLLLVELEVVQLSLLLGYVSQDCLVFVELVVVSLLVHLGLLVLLYHQDGTFLDVLGFYNYNEVVTAPHQKIYLRLLG